jgi:hypothetical protein
MVAEEVRLLVIAACRCRRLRRRKSPAGEEINSVMVETSVGREGRKMVVKRKQRNGLRGRV